MSSRNQSITKNNSITDSSNKNFSSISMDNKSKSSTSNPRNENSEVKISNVVNETNIEQVKKGLNNSSSVKDLPFSGHLEISPQKPGKNSSLTSSAVSSIDMDLNQMKNLNDSINLYRDDFGMTVKTETVNAQSQKTLNSLISNPSNTHSKSARHTIKVKNYEKNLIKNLVYSMKNFSVFNISPIVSPIDAIEQLNQEFIQILKCYSLGSRDELKCGVCCIDNLNFKKSFFCKQQLETPLKLNKSQSTLNLKELANKINTFNPFENTIFDPEIKSLSGLKNYKSDESLYTNSECSKLNDSNLSLKLKYRYFDNEECVKPNNFKQLKSMSEISNNLDLTLNSSSTISFMNNSQNTNNYSSINFFLISIIN